MTTIALPATLDASSANAALAQLQQAVQAVQAPAPAAACVLDASAVQRFDSAGLAVLLAARRQALAAGKTLVVAQWPAQLLSLAQAYGVAHLLGGAAPASAGDQDREQDA